MANLYSKSLLGLACAIALASLVCISSPFADDVSGIEKENSLPEKVAALEKTVAQLRQQIESNTMVSSLSGHYWVEESRVLAGEREEQSEEVAWRLSTDVSSNRYILGPEVSLYEFGPFSIDASKDPVWIDFEVSMFGKKHTVKGIVRATYGKCDIAIPGKLFDGNTFLSPDRPTSFESTADNGYDVYSLVREQYNRTGVWQ